jgi:hypothetical protein
LSIALTATPVFASAATDNMADNDKTSFHLTALYLQPYSNNLKYAVFVSGTQPYHQSWHNQSINYGYSPAFDLGFNYAFTQSPYGLSVDWLHAGTSDSSSKQASTNQTLTTVEFVAPPYDVGPGLFAVKRADSTVKNNFNSIEINIGRVFAYGEHIRGKLFGGLNVLSISQNLTTTFSDLRGYPEITGQAYALPPDPSFYFQTKNTSDYLGLGPDLGFNIRYVASNGLGLVGQMLGSLTAGSMSAQDNFTSASRRLILLGINPSQQSITAPNSTQIVPGFDSKLGAIYSHAWLNVNLALEAGYRFAYYMNAISGISPQTLVQAGTNPTIPEFATGTMAINSTATFNSPFSLSGPYLEFTVSM